MPLRALDPECNTGFLTLYSPVHPDRGNCPYFMASCQYSWILVFPRVYFLEVPIEVPMATDQERIANRPFSCGFSKASGESKNSLVRLRAGWTMNPHGREGENAL